MNSDERTRLRDLLTPFWVAAGHGDEAMDDELAELADRVADAIEAGGVGIAPTKLVDGNHALLAGSMFGLLTERGLHVTPIFDEEGNYTADASVWHDDLIVRRNESVVITVHPSE